MDNTLEIRKQLILLADMSTEQILGKGGFIDQYSTLATMLSDDNLTLSVQVLGYIEKLMEVLHEGHILRENIGKNLNN
jgi:hypothetical protein